MRATLRQLVELQRLDDELHRIAEAIAVLPAQREASERELEAGRQRLADAGGQLEERQRELRHTESALQDAEALLKRLEAQQSQVKTNEAYTALLHEIDAAAQAISRAETQILEGMDAVEEGSARLVAERTSLARLEQDTRARLAELEQRGAALAAERRRLEEDRASLAGEIADSALELYNRIAQRRKPAVALVENQVCMGCRVGIPPQLHLELIVGERLVACSSCRRILILPRMLEEHPGA